MKKEFDILDILTILSYVLAAKNLEENRQQTDDTQKILQELEYHLRQQDEILENQNKILYKLNGGNNG